MKSIIVFVLALCAACLPTPIAFADSSTTRTLDDIVFPDVHFAKGSAILSHKEEVMLASIAHRIVSEGMMLAVEGRIAIDGSPAHNTALATARAREVSKYLVEQGVSPSSLALSAFQVPPVVIYGANWCEFCNQAVAYMKRKNIAYIERDIDNDESARKDMNAALDSVGASRGSIPVIVVGGALLTGFHERAVQDAVGKSSEENRIVRLYPIRPEK